MYNNFLSHKWHNVSDNMIDINSNLSVRSYNCLNVSTIFFLFRPKPNTAYVVCLVHRIIKWLHLFFQQQKVETLNFNFRFTLFCFVFYLYKSGRLTGMEQKLEGMHICQFNCMSKE